MLDYLKMIRTSKNLDNIAMYIRAQSNNFAATLTVYTESDRISFVEKCEQRAKSIEMCETREQARKLLIEWNYI